MWSMLVSYLTDGQRHLVCLPYSIEGLHRMAADLAIKKCWFHRNHYDIPKKRILEIEGKCKIVSSRDIVKIIQGDICSVDPIVAVVAAGTKTSTFSAG